MAGIVQFKINLAEVVWIRGDLLDHRKSYANPSEFAALKDACQMPVVTNEMNRIANGEIAVQPSVEVVDEDVVVLLKWAALQKVEAPAHL